MWNRIKNVEWSYWITGLFSMFVLQWFGVRIGSAREGKPGAWIGPWYYFLCGWTLPVSGYFGLRRVDLSEGWMLRLHRPRGRGWIVRWPRRSAA